MSINKIKSTVKYPTSIIVNGATNLGLELADSLLEQGGYVIIIDTFSDQNQERVARLGNTNLLSFVDHSIIPHLEEEVRRLDYVFYLNHDSTDLTQEISTQQFLQYSNYLDAILGFAAKFEAKFLLTTSIKAHQMILASQEIDVNFGTQAKAKHSVYSQMEVQKYAESLVVEYIDKVNLDARILRLGEIIGDGMEFISDTPFNQLILSAVQGKKLPVYKDGLNTELYIHILDAVYGFIKAQFSRNTAGEIFTLAYEESYSDLSIAYKIHDFEPEAGEIEFIDAEAKGSNLPPLKLYKPAKNLAAIGWKPRVDIDEAVKQSLSAAKLFIAENAAMNLIGNAENGDGGAGSKLKSFLKLAKDSKPGEGLSEAEAGPLAKLISERKKQESIKIINISNGNQKLNKKRSARSLSPLNRISNAFWGVFLNLRKSVSWLSNMTPGQLLFWIILGFVSLALYFGLISPAIVLARNYAVTTNKFNEINTALATNNFRNTSSDLATMEGALIESNKIISRYGGLANVLALNKQYTQLLGVLDAYTEYVSGMKDVSQSLDPVYKYLAVYQDKTFFRPNSESYLAVEVSYDYSDYLKPIRDNAPLSIAGENKVNTAVALLDKLDMSSLPTGLQKSFQDMNTKMKEMQNTAQLGRIVQYLPELLAVDAPKTYLILLQDNSRFTHSGGDISAFALLTIQNGSVKEVRVQSINSINLDMTKVESIYRDIANNHAFLPTTAQDFTLADLGNISSYSDYSLAMKHLFEGNLNKQIDGVITMDYTMLEGLSSQLSSVDGKGISVENVEFNGVNLLNNLKLMQAQSESLARRNDVAAQLLASVLDKGFDNLNSQITNYVISLSKFRENKDLQLNLFKLSLNKDLVATQHNITDANSYIKTSIKADPRIISPNKFPSVTLTTKSIINEDISLSFTSKLKFSSVDNVKEVNICLPADVLNIKVGLDITKYRISNGIKEKCVVVNITNESEISLSWDILPIASLNNSQYNLLLGLFKQPGLAVVSEYELTLDGSLKVIKIDPAINLEANQNLFSENMSSDRFINILLSK